MLIHFEFVFVKAVSLVYQQMVEIWEWGRKVPCLSLFVKAWIPGGSAFEQLNKSKLRTALLMVTILIALRVNRPLNFCYRFAKPWVRSAGTTTIAWCTEHPGRHSTMAVDPAHI